MATFKTDIEITLVSLHVNTTGSTLASTRHILTAGLVWPRTGTARKVATMPITMERGHVAADRLPWSRRILFRETVEGRFGFELALTVPLADAEADAFLRAWASHLMQAVGEGLESSSGATPLAGFAAFPLAYLAKVVLKAEAPAALAEGLLDRDREALPAAGGRALWTVPLVATEGVVQRVRRPGERRPRITRRVLVAPGAVIGEAVVEVARPVAD